MWLSCERCREAEQRGRRAERGHTHARIHTHMCMHQRQASRESKEDRAHTHTRMHTGTFTRAHTHTHIHQASKENKEERAAREAHFLKERADIEALFDELDLDRSGQLDIAEIRAAFTSLARKVGVGVVVVEVGCMRGC